MLLLHAWHQLCDFLVRVSLSVDMFKYSIRWIYVAIYVSPQQINGKLGGLKNKKTKKKRLHHLQDFHSQNIKKKSSFKLIF